MTFPFEDGMRYPTELIENAAQVLIEAALM